MSSSRPPTLRSFSNSSVTGFTKPTRLSQKSLNQRLSQYSARYSAAREIGCDDSVAENVAAVSGALGAERYGKKAPCEVQVELLSASEQGFFVWLNRGPVPDVFGPRFWFIYGLMRIWEQMSVVIPMALYLLLFDILILRKTPPGLENIIPGVVLAVCIGLAIFLEGLKLGIMPLGEVIGHTLPLKATKTVTLCVMFVLGIGVTFAEPAIGALQQVGESVDPALSPYLYYMLNQWETPLVFSVGVGVGFAAVLGTLRFLWQMSMKTILYPCVAAVLILTAVVYSIGDMGKQIIGLAWDCGAVTTGPVTVPLVLSLGMGIVTASKAMNAEKELTRNRDFTEAADEARSTRGGAAGRSESGTRGSASAAGEEEDALDGFGVVTLASLFPIFTVLGLGLLLTALKSEAEIRQEISESLAGDTTSGMDTLVLTELTPVKEILYTLQAICPLVAFLLLVLLGLKEPVPVIVTFVNTGDGNPEEDLANPRGPYESSVAIPRSPSNAVVSAGASMHQSIVDNESSGAVKSRKIPLLAGLGLAMLGIMIFNIGLSNGLTVLGDSVGNTLPALFEEIPGPDQLNDEGLGLIGPFHSYDLGLFLCLAFSWALGLGATLAEPALNNLGRIVELNSGGKFSKRMVTSSVSCGVSIGLMVGVLKIVLDVPVIWLIVSLYPLALLMTAGSDEDIVCIAWDSAGVTTGEITVPLVLALGTGIGKTGQSLPEGGFGILTMCSIAPIGFMLLMGIYAKAMRKKKMAGARTGAATTDRSMQGSAMEETSIGADGNVTLLHAQGNALHDDGDTGTSTSSSAHYVAPEVPNTSSEELVAAERASGIV
jgi:hypothetical protein